MHLSTNNNTSKPIICIVGPTASGKSALAQKIALSISGEIVSADSMQIYKRMDIGTGKILGSEQLVPHFGLDLIEPGQTFSAALFQSYSRSCFTDIQARGNWPILCGGTGFYIRAAIDDYHFPKGEQEGNAIREHYQDYVRLHGNHMLWEKLSAVDPKSAAIIPENDTKRLIRAFELLSSNTSYAMQKEKLASIAQLLPAFFIGIKVDSEILNNRIDARIDAMIEAGWLKEVENLLKEGFRDAITAPQAIGYKELVQVIEKNLSMDEAVSKIKIATHRYAKRQRTWFNKDKRIHWINGDALNLDDMFSEAEMLIDTIVQN